MGNILTEPKRLSDWLKGELQDVTDFCRESITILAGESLVTGTVLAKLSSGGGQYVQFDPGASAGAGSDTAVGILITDSVDGDTTADQEAAALLRGPVTIIKEGLTWADNVTTGQKNTALAALKVLGMIVREAA